MLSWLAALALTLPFVLALPRHYEPDGSAWHNAAVLALLGAIYLAATFVTRLVARQPDGSRAVTVFAALSLIVAVLGVMGAEQYSFTQAAADLALLYLIFFAASALAGLGLPLGRAALALAVPALVVTAIIQAVHYHNFGFPIGADGYRAILQSNPGESFEFVSRFVDPGSLAAAVVAFAVALAAAFGALPLRLTRVALGWAAVQALVMVVFLAQHVEAIAPKAQVFTESYDYLSEVAEYRTLRAARQTSAKALAIEQDPRLAREPQTFVFIVGESLTRNHMSLYGYWRATTPGLERLRPEMAVFTDVTSPHSHTDQSLELVLTLAKQDNKRRFTDADNYSLVELLRAAGFATWWISNQSSFGPWDNKTAVLGGAADHVHYVSKRSGAMVVGPPDEVLLEPFGDALKDPAPRKAIFLHFLGNHWAYAKRYPAKADVFHRDPSPAEIGALVKRHPRQDLINHYDNAVHYDDQIATRVIEMLRATGRLGALTLFSDHGESVYQLKGHYWREFTHDHVEVPLIVWFSPAYAERMPQVVARARERAAVPFALENLPHLAADLIGLRSAVFEPARSPLADGYRAPRERALFDGEQVYEQANEAPLNAKRHLAALQDKHSGLAGRLWAHRVDTLGKMKEAAAIFAGVEIDVLHDAKSGVLLVNHPPETASGLTLDAQLAYANRLNPSLSFWLDLKNLSEANAAAFIAELKRLDRVHAFRGRALVETDHTGPAAAALRAAGFRSSYYLPMSTVLQNTPGQAGYSCYGATDIERLVRERRFAAISYDWRGLPWVERCLGKFVRAAGLARYSWDLEAVLSERRLPAALDDVRLRQFGEHNAVLVPYRSIFDDT